MLGRVLPIVSPGFSGGSDRKESACNVRDTGLISGLGRYPEEGNSLPGPVFLPGEFHGLWSLEGHSLWGRKELDTTERITYIPMARATNASSITTTNITQLFLQLSTFYSIIKGPPMKKVLLTL